jgi:exonuclease III
MNKEILEPNDTIDLMDLTDLYRIFHPATAQYTFFSVAHGTFSKIDHILGHKVSLNKYKIIETKKKKKKTEIKNQQNKQLSL